MEQPSDLVDLVFAHWQKVMGKQRSALNKARRSAIEARLAEGYRLEDLTRAIEGCRADPWSMGANDRCTPYNDVELICRDAKHIDKFLGIAARDEALSQEPEAELGSCSCGAPAVELVTGRTPMCEACAAQFHETARKDRLSGTLAEVLR